MSSAPPLLASQAAERVRDRENRIEFSGAVIFLIVAAIGAILLALVAIGPLAALVATLDSEIVSGSASLTRTTT